ncbi:hypothetical protein LCGC14_1413360 [marine sediment metagenome]|uniref:Uncharacterized protein n=1 Tax=marine sediment metagenome TaxID=412755 RepID=A0A0F9JTJ6_9ZZZZ|nr:hypothetical protein [Candidatus Aminicenantes bacterium]
MKLCEDGHVNICHDRGNSCPLCDSIEERENWKKEAEGLNDHIKELMNTVARLEEEKENSGDQGSEKHKASAGVADGAADLDTQHPSEVDEPTPDPVNVALSEVMEFVNDMLSSDPITHSKLGLIVEFIEKKIEGLTVGKKEGEKE